MPRNLTALLIAGAFAAGVFASAVPAFAEHTRVTNPNSLNVELLGRGLLYSVNFDRVVNDDLVAGVGFGSTPMRNPDGSDPGISTFLLPFYVNYYFAREQGSIFVTAGADIASNGGSLNGLKSMFGNIYFNGNAVLPTAGIGYENRSDAGFLFRVTVYGIYAASVNPWAGFTLGYAF